mmetsp:Transcript_159278/g.297072  ORF Transcript_159278/g.297072 Transcript_159278/m.297072 type:complete len:113 (-) Transcript_159278:2537-2875(-)
MNYCTILPPSMFASRSQITHADRLDVLGRLASADFDLNLTDFLSPLGLGVGEAGRADLALGGTLSFAFEELSGAGSVLLPGRPLSADLVLFLLVFLSEMLSSADFLIGLTFF